jgi:phage terminase large subunit-like protein
LSTPVTDPVVAAEAVKRMWAEQARRQMAQTELQKEQNKIREAERYRKKLYSYFPETGPLRREMYPRHMQFVAAGARHRERAFIAWNRIGKTETGAYEITCHLTGWYPKWWTGKRFARPIKAWAAGTTGKKVQEILQAKLLGITSKATQGAEDQLVIGLGTGMIPGAAIINKTAKAGVADAVDTVYVRHKSGGTSILSFKSYESGREAFEGTEQDVIWLDEEPDMSIYTECLLRTMTTNGVVFITFTPLEGLTPVILNFLPGGNVPEDGLVPGTNRFVVMCDWDHAPHLTEEAKKELWQTIPAYQRDARSRGVPQLGAGAIYPVAESDIVVKPFQIPDTWRKCYGLDVGWNRTAAIWLAEDPLSKIWYAYSEHYVGRQEPALQAQAIRARGVKIPGVIDPASRGRGQRDGDQLFQDYLDLGLDIKKAKNAVESGLYEVWQMFTSGLLKVFDTLQYYREEFRIYRRDDKGHVVKDRDHLQDAMRYCVVSGRDIARADAPPAPTKKITQLPRRGGESSSWMGY